MQNPMLSRDRFLLGTFASNCSGGMSVTEAPERWVNSWEKNLALGKMLDAAGIDFMLPIARWIGYGGETDFHGGVLRAQSFPHDLLKLIRDRMAAGHGGYPLGGTPQDVADGISAIAEAGFRGTTLSFVDYLAEFPYFRDEVLPLLEARGLRGAATAAAAT